MFKSRRVESFGAALPPSNAMSFHRTAEFTGGGTQGAIGPELNANPEARKSQFCMPLIG